MLRNFVPSKERRDAKKQAMLFTDMYVFEEDIDSNDVELFQTPIKVECPEVRCTLFRPTWVGMLPPEMGREIYKYFPYEERAKNLLQKHPNILDPDSGLQDFFHCKEIEKIFAKGFVSKVTETQGYWRRPISKRLTELLPKQSRVKYIDQHGHNVVHRHVHPVIKVLLKATEFPRSFRSFQPVRNAINHLMNITTNSPFDVELRRIGYNLIASIIIFIDTVKAKRQRVANEKAEKAKIRAEKRAKQRLERDAHKEAIAAARIIQEEEERLALAAQRAARNAAREQAKVDRREAAAAAAAQAKAERIAAAAQAKEERRAAAAQAKAERRAIAVAAAAQAKEERRIAAAAAAATSRYWAKIKKLHVMITAKEAKEAAKDAKRLASIEAKAAKVAEKEAAKDAKRLASIEAKAAKIAAKEEAKDAKRLASIEAKAAKVAEKEAAKAAKVAAKEAAKVAVKIEHK
jgi:hypothetical protein